MGHHRSVLRVLRRHYFPGRWVHILPVAHTEGGIPRRFHEAQVVSHIVPTERDPRIVIETTGQSHADCRTFVVPLRYVSLRPLTYPVRPLIPRGEGDEPRED